MKYFYTTKEYLKALLQCLAYVYKFDKKGTILRLSIVLIFPVIANSLSIVSARLGDAMQQNFGTGIIAALIPIFTVLIGIQIVDEIFRWLRNRVTWVWQSKVNLLISVERQRKKSTFSIPFIDSEDYDQLHQRIDYAGAGFNSQVKLITSFPDLIKIIINVIFAAAIVFSFNPWLTIILAISTIPGFAVSFTQSFALRQDWEKQLTYMRVTGVYENHFGRYVALKDTKAAGSANQLLKIFHDRRDYTRERTYNLYKKYLNFGLLTNLLSLAIGCAVQYFVIKEVVFGTILIGQATLVIAQAFRLQSTMQELAWFLPDQYENVIASKYLFLYLNTTENVEPTSLPTPITDLNQGIKLKDVKFTYPEVTFEGMRKLNAELDEISEKYFKLKKEPQTSTKSKKESFELSIPQLEIKPGERVAIVGKNGNGKTTFTQLVLNLYPTDSGSITLFGNDVKHMNQYDVQKYYSVLFQDYSQSNLKTHEYIALSDIGNPDMDRVKWAVKQATATEFIEKWSDQYTQQLGVAFKGVKPSNGQWQKLALARAFYKDAPIMILDEPTAAIDAISAKQIFENLAAFDSNKILLFVCHNMSDIPLAATRILVFDKGHIVGDGSHKDLLKTCEVYKELYESEKHGRK